MSTRFAILVLALCLAPLAWAAPFTASSSTSEPFLLEDDGDGTRFEEAEALIEGIEVIGLDKTRSGTVLSRLSFEAGERLNDEKVEQSRLRLLGTGFFQSVELSLRRGSRRGYVIVLIEVLERNTIALDGIHLGYSRTTPWFLGFGLNESNLLGRGVSAGASFVVSPGARAVDLHLLVPELSGTPLQFSVSATYVRAQELFDEAQPDGPRLAYSRFGGSIGLGFRAGAAQRIALVYRIESVVTDSLYDQDPALLRSAPSIQTEDSFLSTLGLFYERDTRDDPFVPRAGSRFSLSAEVGSTLLGSTYEFSKYAGEAWVTLPAFARHALSLKLFGGLIQGQAPFFSQFFIGDYAYTTFGGGAFPRVLGVNFSEKNDYDDLLGSVSLDYGVPVVEQGRFFYRVFLYGVAQLSASASLDERQEDPSGRGVGDRFPLSFDLGLRADCPIGYLTVSFGYVLELVR